MMAELRGRVSGVGIDKGTGALTQVIVSSQNGEVVVFKPDEWLDQQAWQESLGKTVNLRVVATVEP